MVTKNDIKMNKPFIAKWENINIDDSTKEVADGIVHGQATEFMTRLESEAQFLSECRSIEMNGPEQDIQHLRVKAKLQNLKQISGANKGAQIQNLTDVQETVPTFLKQTLIAGAFTTYTIVPKLFLKDNIEKDGFMNKFQSILAPSAAFSAEQIAFYGIDDVSQAPTGQETDGLYATDGIFIELDKIAVAAGTSTDPKAPQGWYDDINPDADLIPQIASMLKAYTKQRGNRKLANIYVDSEMEADLIDEASNRETVEGDKLFFFDSEDNLVIRGRKVVQLDVLDEPLRDLGRTVLIANPDSIAYGPIMDAEAESSYEQLLKSYVTSTDFSFAVGIIFAEDVLGAKIREPTNVLDSVAFSILNVADDSAINGASVEIEVPGANKTGTTGAAGGCNISNVPEGTYDVNVSATGFDDKTVSTVFNNATGTVVIKLTGS